MGTELSQFHEAFFAESLESLDAMEAALLTLDPGSPNADAINSVFRAAHSIKGGSGMFGFTTVTSFTHSLESLLDELRNGRRPVTAGSVDLLLTAADTLRSMLKATQQGNAVDEQAIADVQFDLEQLRAQPVAGPAPEESAAVSAEAQAVPPAALAHRGPDRSWQIVLKPNAALLVHGNDPLRMFAELAELGDLTCAPDAQSVPAFPELNPEICYLTFSLELRTSVDLEVIRAVFEWAEGDCELSISEVITESAVSPQAPSIKCDAESQPPLGEAAPPRTADAPTSAAPQLQAVAKPPSPEARPVPVENFAKAVGQDAASIRVNIEKIDELMNTVGEMVITQSMLMQLAYSQEPLRLDVLRNGISQLERNVRELQESVMRVRMLPISFTFSRFHRLVRDLSHRLGKKIELKLSGEQTEVDKTVLEKIIDPLVHLVRNSIDHGIESPEARVAAGKPEAGTVSLNAFHRGGAVIIEVSDDGAGLNLEKILSKARANALIGVDETPSDEAIAELIFLPGFSTADKATDLSGRGVGMDVVRRNVKDLGGNVQVRSEPGRGTSFVISLPLTLAIVDGQSVGVGQEIYIVPLVAIIESLQIRGSAVNRLPGYGEVIPFRGDYLPLIRLHQLFGVTSRFSDLEKGIVMIVEGDGRRVGLFVDELLGQQQVVIKSLESNFKRIEGVSGATILGQGNVALILDIPGLVRCAAQRPLAA